MLVIRPSSLEGGADRALSSRSIAALSLRILLLRWLGRISSMVLRCSDLQPLSSLLRVKSAVPVVAIEIVLPFQPMFFGGCLG